MAFVIWFGKDLMVKVMVTGMAVYRQHEVISHYQRFLTGTRRFIDRS